MIKRNPAKPKQQARQVKNISNVIETLNFNSIKITLSNAKYPQLQDRTWRDFDTGKRTAG